MNGIEYMHKEGVYHRDLKLENILLNEELELMIADFGLSIKKNKMQGPYASGIQGSPSYIPPEVHSRKLYDPALFDIFSAGVILFILYEGKFPFTKAIQTDLYYSKIMTGNFELFWKYSEKRGKRSEGYFS